MSIENEENVYSILPNTPVINYPNPFNPSTTILTYIPESGLLQVSVIDLLGRNVRMLYDEMVYEGESWKKIIWDGLDNNRKEVPGGVYFSQGRNGQASMNHKMIMLK